MAQERVDRARKMVRRILFRVAKGMTDSRSRFTIYQKYWNFVAEIICHSTRSTATPSSSSISTGHISRLCVFSTNASGHIYIYIALID